MSDINFLLLCEQVFAEATCSRQLLQEALDKIIQLCRIAKTLKTNFTNLARLEQNSERKQALKDMLLNELFRIRNVAIQHVLEKNHNNQIVSQKQIEQNPDNWFDIYFVNKYFNDYQDIAYLTKVQDRVLGGLGFLPPAPPKIPDQKLLPDNLPTFDENNV